jgi:aminoglycoside phosphotransferase (APT) family kinase protein
VDFVQQCAQASGFDLADPDLLVDERGMQNLVLLHPRRGLAARFPRTAEGCALLPDAAARLRFLRSHGVPVPRVLDVYAEAGGGRGYLLLEYVQGVPLDEVRTDDLPTRTAGRLVRDLIGAAARIHAVPPAGWPSPARDWRCLWSSLVGAVAECDALPHDVRQAQLQLALRAAATSATARIGVFHGDLGGVNCRVDPDSGAVVGLLDWDSATIGDITTDLVAVLAGVGPRTADLLRGSDQEWAAAEQNYAPYLATWPVQHYLWSLRHSLPSEQQQALVALNGPVQGAAR